MLFDSLEARALFSAGDLDTTFGAGGIVSDPSAGIGLTSAATPVPDAKILVAGYAGAKGHHNFQLLRLNSDGSLDSSFGTNGRVVTDFGGDERAGGMLRTGKKVILYGVSDPTGDTVLARYHIDGRIDKSFGSKGKLHLTDGRASDGIGVDDLGRIKVLTNNGILSLNSDGSIDESFGDQGTLPSATISDRTGVESIGTIAVRPNGHIIVAGNSEEPGFEGSEVGWRNELLADGTLDPNADGGQLGSDFSALTSIQLLPDGQVIYSGTLDSVGNLAFNPPVTDPSELSGSDEAQALGFARPYQFVTGPDGQLYAVGRGGFGLSSLSGTKDVYVARYNDQSLDLNFVRTGYTFTRLPTQDAESITDIVSNGFLDSDGNLVVLAGALPFQERFLLRYQTSPDNPFASVNSRRRLNIFGTPGADVIDVKSEGSNIIAALNGHELTFAADAIDKITIDGFAGNDSITTSVSRRAYLHGDSGNDTLIGWGRNDELFGEDGNDSLVGGGGNDLLDGGDGLDTLLGQKGNDRFLAMDGAIDSVNGGSGTDSAEADKQGVLDILTSIESS